MRFLLPILMLGLALGTGGLHAADEQGPVPVLYADQGTVAEPGLHLPQWDRVLRRIVEEEPRYDICVQGGACPSPQARRWLMALQALEGEPRDRQLAGVDSILNVLPYRSDIDTYGVRDRWATPFEFLARSGDCEDYAIAKYVSLRRLGVPREELRLAVVQDTQRDTQHAVLLALGEHGWMVLDNLASEPVSMASVTNYLPYYSFDETMRWTHALLGVVQARLEEGRPSPAGELDRD